MLAAVLKSEKFNLSIKFMVVAQSLNHRDIRWWWVGDRVSHNANNEIRVRFIVETHTEMWSINRQSYVSNQCYINTNIILIIILKLLIRPINNISVLLGYILWGLDNRDLN